MEHKRNSINWSFKWKCFEIGMKKHFKRERPKIQYEPFFIAELNDETKTGLANAAQRLKIQLFYSNAK